MKIERRFHTELRAESQGDEMFLVGYASVFGSESEDLGGFREMVMPGAFSRSLREGADVKFLMNHDPSLVMGRTKNGTLQLEEDGKGLRFRATLPATQAARDLYALVKRGDMDQCSFAFTVRSQSWDDNARDGNGDLYTSRKLMDVDLLDCSAVTYPAYASTEVSARMFPDGVPVEVRSAVDKAEARRKAKLEARYTDGTFEDRIDDINCALKDTYGLSSGSGCYPAGCSKYWIIETYPDHVIVCNNDEGCYYDVPYTYVADKVTFGEMKEVQQVYVASDRMALIAEVRGSENQAPIFESIDLPQPADPKMKADWYDEFASQYKKLMKKGGQGFDVKQALGKAIAAANKKVQPATEADDQGTGKKDPTPLAGSQVDTIGDRSGNKDKTKMAKEVSAQRDRAEDVSDPDSDNYDPEDPDYDEALDPTNGEGRGKGKSKKGAGAKEGADEGSDGFDDASGDDTKDGKKTRKVGDRSLPAESFAFVGNPNDPSTFKLPIDTALHVVKSIERFSQVKVIPADLREATWRNIVTAAKQYVGQTVSIKINEEDSIKAGMSHDIVRSIFAEEEQQDKAILDALRARVRCIEIDLE